MDKKTPLSQDNAKVADLQKNISDATDQFMTTNHGTKINDDNNILSAGDRGPSLLEDFIFREKMTHFDHERIPERVVHARGSGAHGVFELYEDLSQFTKAGFLTDVSRKTPVFARFSTVQGSRGSTDLPRDIRGFAVKFYTDEGIYDLVGNNTPVFFIQDGNKFPDLVHALKPEQPNEIPQAASAHDTFWDFISLMPESMHNIFWLMSDRAIPKSLRKIEGFGIHTFKLVNAEGKAHFVKFHWKPLLGLESVAWDEAQKISGKDPDYHRRDLWDNIEEGNFPEWELGLQIIPEEDEHKFDFDLLDATKLIPEELVPVRIVGKMTLNRNPDNFFAETEQIAFHPGHVVPGIDFTDDPLLQGRLFSYTDTQLTRLGSPNFHQIPINRSIAPVHNNQREGHMRMTVDKGKASYHPNSLGGGCPYQAMMKEGGFVSQPARVEGHKVRARSKSFNDHFSQAKMFYNSLTSDEQRHVADAFSFELGKVNYKHIKERVVYFISKIDKPLAEKVADKLGIKVPDTVEHPLNHGIGADTDKTANEPGKVKEMAPSDRLSIDKREKPGIKTKKIAVFLADGTDADQFKDLVAALEAEGASYKTVAPKGGTFELSDGTAVAADEAIITTASVLFDGVYVPGGEAALTMFESDGRFIHFLHETFVHCKPVVFGSGAESMLARTLIQKDDSDPLLLTNANGKDMTAALLVGRYWKRELNKTVPA